MRKRGEEKKGKKAKDKDRQKRKIYIFCEGVTEEIYLKHFEDRNYNAEIISVKTDHTDAFGIVQYAKEYINKKDVDFKLELGDRGYCVFDSDPKSNTDIKTVFNLLEGYRHKGLYSIFSNPSFEVWFVLHFREAPYGMSAEKMKQEIKKLVKNSYSQYSETTDIYDFLLPMQNGALKRARLLHNAQKEVHDTVYSHECNPYTDIFSFIGYMNQVKSENRNDLQNKDL